MTSDSDDLERALHENLRLREELAAKAAEAEGALRHSQFADPNWQAFFFAILLLLIFHNAGSHHHDYVTEARSSERPFLSVD